MVEDSQARLGKSTGDLRILVVSVPSPSTKWFCPGLPTELTLCRCFKIGAKTEAALAEDEDFLEAEAALENANL